MTDEKTGLLRIHLAPGDGDDRDRLELAGDDEILSALAAAAWNARRDGAGILSGERIDVIFRREAPQDPA